MLISVNLSSPSFLFLFRKRPVSIKWSKDHSLSCSYSPTFLLYLLSTLLIPLLAPSSWQLSAPVVLSLSHGCMQPRDITEHTSNARLFVIITASCAEGLWDNRGTSDPEGCSWTCFSQVKLHLFNMHKEPPEKKVNKEEKNQRKSYGLQDCFCSC